MTELNLDLRYQLFLRERKTISSMFGRFYEGTRVSDGEGGAEGGRGSRAECQQPQCEYEYQFNAELAGWNYGWQSNKHKTKDWHVFQISVYVLPSPAGSGSGSGCERRQDRMEEEGEDEGSAAAAVGGVAPQDSFSLLLRTCTPPFRILSARRCGAYLT